MTRAEAKVALPVLLGSTGLLAALLFASLASAGPDAAAAAPRGEPGAADRLASAARAAELARLDEGALAPAAEVQIAPSPEGVLGAWLVAGPFRAGRPALEASPLGFDDTKLVAAAGDKLGGERPLGAKRRPPARWTIASSGPPPSGAGQDPGATGSRTIDLKASLEDARGPDLVAYAAGKLHVETAGSYLLMLGVDDGVRVSVDGRIVFFRDDARPVRDDDDVIPLDLTAGDHDVLLKLHQRDGAWAFRAKVVDARLAPAPGTWLTLPGTTADDARALAARMSWLIVDRAFDPRGTPPTYRPILTVRYPEGAPRGVPISVTAKLGAGSGPPLFEVDAGGVAVTGSGVSDRIVTLPPTPPWSGTAALESKVAGRVVTSTFTSRPRSEAALVRAARAIDRVRGDESWLLPESLDSVRYLADRLARLVARGDGDAEAQADEARELDALAASLERGVDPYEGRTGPMRRAIVTPFDDAPSELGVYVPPSYRPGSSRKYPLVVGLHGMNSYPMSMLRALFGLDDDKKPSAWKDRHLVPFPAVEAFVIAPYAHGNAMYREIGEDDVLYMMRWASKVFPIDESRVTITGPSMGGIGAASLPLHFPYVFAASAPLCGYHSYLIRPGMRARPKRPWEQLLLEERSNVFWAENGEHLPLWIVHGTRDLPEANSGVLIERYEKLKYSIKHDHPEAGHDVWGITYGELKGMRWLLSHRLDPHPAHVRFRTTSTRYGKSAWVTVDELADASSWADVEARVHGKTSVAVSTKGVTSMTLARDPRLLSPDGPITVTIDGVALAFEEGRALAMHKAPGGAWEKGPASPSRPVKGGRVSGPIRDVFHEPLLFVWSDDDEARANERVARGFANRPGVHASYPVMSDAEFLARGEPLAHERALFLVGRGNEVLARLEEAASGAGAPFPIRVGAATVTVGREAFTGRELGAAFIHPNPLRPSRYVVVVAGADVPGTLRALSLPDLLPDFVVWDERVAPARGQLLLDGAALRAGGFFENDWTLPASIADPLAKGLRPAQPAEGDAPAGSP